MKQLRDELINRFPEIEELVREDEEIPYLMMMHLFDWVEGECKQGLPEGLIKRIVEFRDWCVSSPEGETAENDLMTIYTVGFYEKLFEGEASSELIPKISSKKDIENNKEYLVNWIGKDNYQKVLNRFD